MTQRPPSPEIGSFRMTHDPNAMQQTPVPDQNQTKVFAPSTEGSDAVRRFINGGRASPRGPLGDVPLPNYGPSGGSEFENSNSMYDPFAQDNAPALPDPPISGTPNLAEQIDDLQRTAASLEKSPEATYLERLKKHNLTIDRAKEIVDAILFKGEYQETFQVTRAHTVTFKSRMFSDQERALRALEQMSPQYPATMAAVVSKNNIASSLVRFAGKDFTRMAFRDKSEYVERLPESLVRLLAIKLGKFDQVIMDIMDDGVIENF